jgi:hypothetical protein
LAAGILAGVVGGYFGFGYHTAPDYVEVPFIRVMLCILFATPVGGVLGLCFDLFQSDRQIPWRTFLGVILVSLVMLAVVVIYGLLYFIPTMKGHGINMSDLQLLFELFVAFSIIIVAIEFNWPIGKIIARIPLFVASVLIARIATYLIMPAMTPPTPHCFSLSCSEFINSVNGRSNFAVSVVLLMAWSVCTYAILVIDDKVNNLFMSILGHHHVDTGH